jgi:hypothetical protein
VRGRHWPQGRSRSDAGILDRSIQQGHGNAISCRRCLLAPEDEKETQMNPSETQQMQRKNCWLMVILAASGLLLIVGCAGPVGTVTTPPVPPGTVTLGDLLSGDWRDRVTGVPFRFNPDGTVSSNWADGLWIPVGSYTYDGKELTIDCRPMPPAIGRVTWQQRPQLIKFQGNSGDEYWERAP